MSLRRPERKHSPEFRNFDKLHEDFDQQFRSVRRTAAAGIIFSSILLLAVLGFLGWVIVKVMMHFGVV